MHENNARKGTAGRGNKEYMGFSEAIGGIKKKYLRGICPTSPIVVFLSHCI